MPSKDYPTVYSAPDKPHLDAASGFGPQYKKVINKVERVQLTAPRVAGVGAILHEDRLRKMCLFNPGKKKFWENPTAEE